MNTNFNNYNIIQKISQVSCFFIISNPENKMVPSLGTILRNFTIEFNEWLKLLYRLIYHNLRKSYFTRETKDFDICQLLG